MQEYPQGPAAAQAPASQQGRRMPGAFDPRTYDPRKMVDQDRLREQAQKLSRAQAVARAKAQATSQIFLATVVSLFTSAFGVVAALAWNQAISDGLKGLLPKSTQLPGEITYALLVTLIAVVVILSLNRVATSIAKKSAIDAAEADAGSI